MTPDSRVVGGGDEVVREGLCHVLVDRAVGLVKDVHLWANHKLCKACVVMSECECCGDE